MFTCRTLQGPQPQDKYYLFEAVYESNVYRQFVVEWCLSAVLFTRYVTALMFLEGIQVHDANMTAPRKKKDMTLNGSRADYLALNSIQNDVHIRQCSRALGLATQYCCGFADKSAHCCDIPEALFQMMAAPSPLLNPEKGPILTLTASSTSSVSSERLKPTSHSASTTSRILTLTPAVPTPAAPTISSSSSSTPPAKPTTTRSSDQPTPLPSTPASSSSTPVSPANPSTLSSPISQSTSSPVKLTTATTTVQASSYSHQQTVALSAQADPNAPNGAAAAAAAAAAHSAAHSAALNPMRVPPGGDRHAKLSTGAMVGVGMGASVAGAGLVTIAVYFFARRRLYKKQQKRWQEQMRAMDNGGRGKSPELGMMGANGGGGGPLATMAVAAQGEKGAPAMVMLARQDMYELPLGFLKTADTRNSGSTFMSSGGGAGGAGGFYASEKDAPYSITATTTTATTTTSTTLPPITNTTNTTTTTTAQSTRTEKTASWFRRNSIYEMP